MQNVYNALDLLIIRRNNGQTIDKRSGMNAQGFKLPRQREMSGKNWYNGQSTTKTYKRVVL